MKHFSKFSGLLILAAVPAIIFLSGRKEINRDAITTPERSGTAILITGAAARIPQEAALLEELYNRGLLNDVVFISGVSSGALNSVMLNGILSGKMTWAEYKSVLFGIENSDIFIQEGKKLPVNTEPERRFITDIVENKLGYHQIGDLPFMTGISITHLSDLNLKKTCVQNVQQKD